MPASPCGIAAGVGRAGEVRMALNTGVLAVCVGPVCAAAARGEGVARPVWPDPPRLGAMIRLVGAEPGSKGRCAQAVPID